MLVVTEQRTDYKHEHKWGDQTVGQVRGMTTLT